MCEDKLQIETTSWLLKNAPTPVIRNIGNVLGRLRDERDAMAARLKQYETARLTAPAPEGMTELDWTRAEYRRLNVALRDSFETNRALAAVADAVKEERHALERGTASDFDRANVKKFKALDALDKATPVAGITAAPPLCAREYDEDPATKSASSDSQSGEKLPGATLADAFEAVAILRNAFDDDLLGDWRRRTNLLLRRIDRARAEHSEGREP